MGRTRVESGGLTLINHHKMETQQKTTERKVQAMMGKSIQGRPQDVGSYEWRKTS